MACKALRYLTYLPCIGVTAPTLPKAWVVLMNPNFVPRPSGNPNVKFRIKILNSPTAIESFSWSINECVLDHLWKRSGARDQCLRADRHRFVTSAADCIHT
ncbi:hypothetical protein M378DRAFT_674265 [Amanita muscaria Koide BX008]|uniref:Uncharacterized protein n=1 Tax=Amanita muscaria (strain Koide BX008) TaxID=946122 RepID=A0A0C2WNV8_AMAMK|nr:hypothetical protein M378DRAFT_674265 [Amanita muscaria Koide BX008]